MMGLISLGKPPCCLPRFASTHLSKLGCTKEMGKGRFEQFLKDLDAARTETDDPRPHAAHPTPTRISHQPICVCPLSLLRVRRLVPRNAVTYLRGAPGL